MLSPAYPLAHGLCHRTSVGKLQEDQQVGARGAAATPAKCDGAVKFNGRPVEYDGLRRIANAELTHATAQSAWVEAEYSSRAEVAFNLPASAIEHLTDMTALHLLQRSMTD